MSGRSDPPADRGRRAPGGRTPPPKGRRPSKGVPPRRPARAAPRTSDGLPVRVAGRRPKDATRTPSPPAPSEIWQDEGPVGGPPRNPRRRRDSVPAPSIDPGELVPLVGARRAPALARAAGEAAGSFAAERFGDARRQLRPVLDEAPTWPPGRELSGLILYRLGRFRAAAKELEAFIELAGGTTEQHPVLADCCRAMGRYDEVDRLWRELREASPSAELVTEGRIVAAGALADQGLLAQAVAELERGWRPPRRPRDHHLRRAYALAALYERTGDVPRARAGFAWIVDHDPGFADARERLDALR